MHLWPMILLVIAGLAIIGCGETLRVTYGHRARGRHHRKHRRSQPALPAPGGPTQTGPLMRPPLSGPRLAGYKTSQTF
jgi:hypothetical protein